MAKSMLGLAAALLCILLTALAEAPAGALAPSASPTPPARAYLPLLVQDDTASVPFTCPAHSANRYSSGSAYQFDLDDPVRPAQAHADKNLALRGHAANTDAGLRRELVSYGADDPVQPPQFATLFTPARVPELTAFHQVNDWLWRPSPEPGSRGAPLTRWPVTALGLRVPAGEVLRVPVSGYDLGQGGEVIALYADAHRVALRYAREDSAGAAGYTLHVEGICTDPNLLALYDQLDGVSGPRYVYRSPAQRPYAYPLPVLAAGQAFGVSDDREVVLAIADTGSFMDPRSCNEWWQIRPGYTGTCPPHELNADASE